MCSTKKLYLNFPVNNEIAKIVESNIGNEKNTSDLLAMYDKDMLDKIVCTLMYHDEHKGPKLIEDLTHKINDIAVARVVSVMILQSDAEPIIAGGNIVISVDAAGLVKCFASVPAFQQNLTNCILDNIQDDGEVSQFGVDDMLCILHDTLVENIKGIDYYTKAKEFIIATANMADLRNAIDNVENAIKLMSSKCTYLYIAQAIENVQTHKDSTTKPTAEA